MALVVVIMLSLFTVVALVSVIMLHVVGTLARAILQQQYVSADTFHDCIVGEAKLSAWLSLTSRQFIVRTLHFLPPVQSLSLHVGVGGETHLYCKHHDAKVYQPESVTMQSMQCN